MKETVFTQAVDDVITLKMKAVDEFIKGIVEPLARETRRVNTLRFRKEYEALKALEKEAE